jgi:DNA-binding transcriptional LysR family regulator
MNILSFVNIKYFCDAVRLNGVTAAAKNNFVTQSAISQGIKKLEDSLGCALLASHPNRFRLTPEGELAFQHMSKLLHQTLEFQKSFSEDHKHALGDLEFACMFSFAYTNIPGYLKKFQTSHPSININLQCSGNPNEIKQLVMSGAVDFGILPSFDFKESDKLRFQKEIAFDIQTQLFVSRHITPQEEKKLKIILPEDFEKEALFSPLYDQKLKKKPQVFLKVSSWVLAAQLAHEGLGIAYLPDFVAAQKVYDLRPCKTRRKFPTIQAYIIYPIGMKLRKSSTIFLSYFEKVKYL